MVESIIGCKWSLRLLELIVGGCRRPSELLRACPGLSTKVLQERLRKMRRFGMVERSVEGEKPPLRVDYCPTPFGRRFATIVEEVRKLQADLDAKVIERRRDLD
ncbi:MAG: winged helix-turn-helix transcriptional regulator [Acidobacteriota bacterium]